MSSKVCKEIGDDCRRRRLHRCICSSILTFIVLFLFVILVVWLVLRPTKPKFYLQDLSIQEFNLTAPNFLSTHLQVTFSSHNPNDRIGVYYDKLDAYAEYKNQRITVPTTIPSGYQGHHDVEVWSPFLFGDQIPVSPYLSSAMGEDENAGFFLINVKVDGRLRWKVGSWVSGHYHIYVNCPSFLTFTDGKGFTFREMVICSVDV